MRHTSPGLSFLRASATAAICLGGVALTLACGTREGGSTVQGDQEVQTTAQAAATRGLEALRLLVTSETARDLGFDTASDAAAAALGEPIAVETVRLDVLKQYAAGADPATIVSDGSRVLYPVTVKGEARSSITVEAAEQGRWRSTRFGSPNLVRQIARARIDAANRGAAPNSTTVVHVAALNVYFVGFKVEGRLMLTALENHPSYKLQAGAVLPASEAFATLSQIARNYNGLPL